MATTLMVHDFSTGTKYVWHSHAGVWASLGRALPTSSSSSGMLFAKDAEPVHVLDAA